MSSTTSKRRMDKSDRGTAERPDVPAHRPGLTGSIGACAGRVLWSADTSEPIGDHFRPRAALAHHQAVGRLGDRRDREGHHEVRPGSDTLERRPHHPPEHPALDRRTAPRSGQDAEQAGRRRQIRSAQRPARRTGRSARDGKREDDLGRRRVRGPGRAAEDDRRTPRSGWTRSPRPKKPRSWKSSSFGCWREHGVAPICQTRESKCMAKDNTPG